MSKKADNLIEKFIKYGMDITSFGITCDIEKYEFFYYIQIYISEIMKNTSFMYIYEDNFYIFDEEGPVVAFAITSSYETIIPVALTTQKDDLCFDIIRCFLIMIKDMREMMPYVISEALKNKQEIANKIGKSEFLEEDHKKYDLKQLLKEMKKIW